LFFVCLGVHAPSERHGDDLALKHGNLRYD
jgi:hypothetical protein